MDRVRIELEKTFCSNTTSLHRFAVKLGFIQHPSPWVDEMSVTDRNLKGPFLYDYNFLNFFTII